ncbi:unnamed protein product [Meloidogyne enterolobii]|uniref:Uncharacterized protein n=1 Tax=Meloidogyne enterolobii TaxID=390850 RepID=A0ACB0ZH07_MELEN
MANIPNNDVLEIRQKVAGLTLKVENQREQFNTLLNKSKSLIVMSTALGAAVCAGVAAAVGVMYLNATSVPAMAVLGALAGGILVGKAMSYKIKYIN